VGPGSKEDKMSQQTFEPVRITGAPAEVEREPLFYLDDEETGEPVEYTIPKKIPANITIQYLRDCANDGQEVALGKAMRVVLGEDAMDALADSESVTDENMTAIMAIVEKKLMAQMKKSLGKSRNGRPR
jgi:hypothetical protein